MPRTASPVAPGTAPAAAADLTTDTTDTAGDDGAAPAGVPLTIEQRLEVAERQNAALMQQMQQVLANQKLSPAMPETLKLPSLASVMKLEPEIPMLTEDGWYVPPVHPTDRLAKTIGRG